MSNQQEFTVNSQDYATTKVPESATTGGLSIGMINGSLAFSVPGLITGVEVGNALGLLHSIHAFLIGGLILSILGAFTGIVGAKNRYTSCITLKFVFGEYGAALISTLFVFALLGWYSVNLDLFSTSLQQLSKQTIDVELSLSLVEALIGVLITIATIWGFNLIEKLSNYLVPIMVMVLFYMLYQSISFDFVIAEPTQSTPMSFGEAVSIIVGSFIVSVVLMPDFSRFAKTSRDAITASFLPFLGISSFVYVISAIAGVAVSNDDILSIMLMLGLGYLAFFLLISASFITNVVNLYSAALGANAINMKWKKRNLVIVLGIAGTVVASFNLLDNFTDFLFSLSIVFTPVAAIYVVDYFFVRNQVAYQPHELERGNKVNIIALTAWGFGILSSLSVNQGFFTLTSIEVFDAIIISSAIYYLLVHRFKTR